MVRSTPKLASRRVEYERLAAVRAGWCPPLRQSKLSDILQIKSQCDSLAQQPRAHRNRTRSLLCALVGAGRPLALLARGRNRAGKPRASHQS